MSVMISIFILGVRIYMRMKPRCDFFRLSSYYFHLGRLKKGGWLFDGLPAFFGLYVFWYKNQFECKFETFSISAGNFHKASPDGNQHRFWPCRSITSRTFWTIFKVKWYDCRNKFANKGTSETPILQIRERPKLPYLIKNSVKNCRFLAPTSVKKLPYKYLT